MKIDNCLKGVVAYGNILSTDMFIVFKFLLLFFFFNVRVFIHLVSFLKFLVLKRCHLICCLMEYNNYLGILYLS